LELLVVMGIMALLMSMGVAGFIGMRRGAEIRSAVSVVQSTLMLARQQAVTKRRTVEIRFLQSTDLATNWMTIVEMAANGADVPVHGDVVLSPGVEYSTQPPVWNASDMAYTNAIRFRPTGNAGAGGISEVRIKEKSGPSSPQEKKIIVWNLTGATRVD
jgi:Tfp pilus assembly protein FimT